MKSWDESEASGVRWSEVPMELWPDWEVVWEECTVDYQGHANVLLHKNGKFIFLEWSHGSCSGCDGWEDMSEEARKEDFNKLAEHFDSAAELVKWAEMVKKRYEGMYEAIGTFLFDLAVEEKFSN